MMPHRQYTYQGLKLKLVTASKVRETLSQKFKSSFSILDTQIKMNRVVITLQPPSFYPLLSDLQTLKALEPYTWWAFPYSQRWYVALSILISS